MKMTKRKGLFRKYLINLKFLSFESVTPFLLKISLIHKITANNKKKKIKSHFQFSYHIDNKKLIYPIKL